jgi:hypothetical protein
MDTENSDTAANMRLRQSLPVNKTNLASTSEIQPGSR